MLLIFAYNNGGVLTLAGSGVAAVVPTTTWFDEQQSQVTGTRSIVQPGYHKNGRNY